MRRHGFDILAMWESRTPERTEFVYLLSWPDLATAEAAWEAFRADPEWVEVKRVSAEKHGDLVGEISEHFLVPTPYSAALVGSEGQRRKVPEAKV